LEGLVAKRRDSLYEPGLRSGAWQKTRINQRQEFVIGGYTPSLKNFDALIIGYYEGGKLLFAARTASHRWRSRSITDVSRQLATILGAGRRASSRIWLSFGNHILTVMMKASYSGPYIPFGISMDEPNTDLIQGTLDMLILKTLSLEPMHGFGIARRIEQVSRGVFKVNPGSLLTAFQRLERVGWLDSEWRQTDKSRRAKFYSLTRSGRKQLVVETVSWNRRASAIARLLKAEG
jgi:PadR family transcriptional regulator, regulatory protein PadR